jgi:ABC-type uncharacterized transport system involved in gliding motility auxiliary subunit
MKEISRAAGIVGAAALVIGGILYMIQTRFSPWIIAFLAAGTALVILFLVLNFGMVIAALGKRTTMYGLNLAVAVLVMLAILVLIQLIFTHNKTLNHRFDLTEAKIYSLSEQSISILESLQKDVTVTAFYQDAQDKEVMENLLELYDRYSPRFSYELLDTDRSPQQAELLGVTSYNTAVVQCGDKKEELSFGSPQEEELTNALITVTRDVQKVIYFTSGHGEKSISASSQQPGASASMFKTAIEKQAYEVKEIVIARERGGIPAECSALVVAGPKTDFYPYELEQIDRYLQEGGRALFMLDPEAAAGVAAFLEKYGVIVGNDYVLDPNPLSQFLGGDYLSPLITDYSPTHEITREFNFACLMSLVRSTRLKDGLETGIRGEWIARASDESWAETNFALLKNARQARYDPTSDLRGPVPVAVAMTIDLDTQAETEAPEEAEKREARLVVIGDSDMGADRFLRPENKNLLLNAVSWLVEEEDLISILPKRRKSSPLLLSKPDQRVLLIVPLLIMPGSVVIAGGLVYWNRRKYR